MSLQPLALDDQEQPRIRCSYAWRSSGNPGA